MVKKSLHIRNEHLKCINIENVEEDIYYLKYQKKL